MTEYIILYQRPTAPGDEWEQVGKVSGRGAPAAINAHLEAGGPDTEGDGDGTYVAVPARSWKPRTLATETQTKRKWS